MNKPAPEKKLYTLEEVRQVIPVSRQYLYKHIRLGNIPCKRFGSKIFIPAAWVERQTGDSGAA